MHVFVIHLVLPTVVVLENDSRPVPPLERECSVIEDCPAISGADVGHELHIGVERHLATKPSGRGKQRVLLRLLLGNLSNCIFGIQFQSCFLVGARFEYGLCKAIDEGKRRQFYQKQKTSSFDGEVLVETKNRKCL